MSGSAKIPEDAIETVEIAVEEGVLRPLLGPGDTNLHYLQRFLGSKITARREKVLLRGTQPENNLAVEVLTEMIGVTRRRGVLTTDDIDTIVRLSGNNSHDTAEEVPPKTSILRAGDRIIGPRTHGQEMYYRAILKHDITFGIGPAGTGKTFIAVAVAVSQFLAGKYDRITLVRPVVEAGESLGFLPGDIREKVDPYFRPLYDALMVMLPVDRLRKFLDRSIIEIAPLAYMRGRTLDNCFVILDEAQNTTFPQMKMFLTRLGENSRSVITGDLTQVDLQHRRDSGLISIQHILTGIEGVKFVYLNESDVVRHPLVARIITAYEEYHSRQGADPPPLENSQ
jgi:phosphate starvation-inducible PhoH-like protein